MRANSTTAVLLLLALLGASRAVAAQAITSRSDLERQHMAETRTRYGEPSWPRGALRAGIANDLLLAGFVQGQLDAAQGLVTRPFSRAGVPDAPPSFVVESIVADSADGAHEALVAWLAGVQSPMRMPSLAELGLALGDAGFAGRAGAAPEALAWIVFVRGNVAVRISACDPVREPDLDVGALARAVDQAILAVPALGEGLTRPARPSIRRLEAPRATLVAGESLRLEVEVADPAGGAPHLQWTLGGPGQGYVERAADGTWRLVTSGPGELVVRLEATGSTGTFTSHELRLDVLDD